MKEQSEDVRVNPEKEVSNLMKLSSLLFELSHPWRLKLLLLIMEEGQRHSYISQKLKISPQETSRHLTRLQDAKLIEKDTGIPFNTVRGHLPKLRKKKLLD